MLNGMHIHGIGTAVPEHSIEQQDAATLATSMSGHDAKIGLMTKLYRRSGVRTRHSVLLKSSTNGAPAVQSFYPLSQQSLAPEPTTDDRMSRYEAEAPALACGAATEALRRAQTDPTEITHLVTVSCTGFSAPGVDTVLCDQLGLSPGVQRTHIGFMGCHGALNALRVADAFARGNPESNILICAVELCSLHFQYGWHPQRVVTNALFADGAAAIVGKSSAAGTRPWGEVVSTAAHRIPNTTDLMSWRIGDHGFQMTLSSQVPGVIQQELRAWICQWLDGQEVEIDDVGAWAIHPGGPRILDACEEALGLTDELMAPSRKVLAQYGNMSSPTVLFILDEIRKSNAGDHCVLLAFGPGLTVEATLINLY